MKKEALMPNVVSGLTFFNGFYPITLSEPIA